jgi:hypothetical protein
MNNALFVAAVTLAVLAAILWPRGRSNKKDYRLGVCALARCSQRHRNLNQGARLPKPNSSKSDKFSAN